MSTPRSVRMAGPVQVPSAGATVATCPAGKRWLVRGIRALVGTGSTPDTLILHCNGTTPATGFFKATVPPAGMVLDSTPMVVNAGETIHAITALNNVTTLTIVGSELDVP